MKEKLLNLADRVAVLRVEQDVLMVELLFKKIEFIERSISELSSLSNIQKSSLFFNLQVFRDDLKGQADFYGLYPNHE